MRPSGLFVDLIIFWILGSAFAQAQAPFLNQPLIPQSGAPGGAFILTVNGTGFAPGAAIDWNGVAKATTFVSAQRLTAKISPSDTHSAGTISVTVKNPTGPASNVGYFSITSQFGFSLSEQGDVNATPRLAVADLNGDGKMDSIEALVYTDTIAVSLGNGDGTFQGEVVYSTAAGPNNVIVGDFNGDGKIDVAALCNTSVVSVLLGKGDGTLQPHIDSAIDPGNINFGIAAGDFNGDGKLDLVVGYQTATANSISVLLGHGDGTFAAPVDYSAGSEPGAVAVGDFNHDGKLDIVAANFGNFAGNSVSILLGNGDGTFQLQKQYDTSNGPVSVVVADFNGDGRLDLAVACACGNSATCGRPGDISILLGNGNGTFQKHADYRAHGFPYTLIADDFDGDGVTDLAATNLDTFDVSILPGLGNGRFGQTVNFETLAPPVGLAAGDFNNNGKLDIVVGTNVGFTLMLH